MAEKRRKRRICVLTGTRAEYGLLTSLLKAVDDHPWLALDLAVTGMHLLEEFGHTRDDIAADGWEIALSIPIYSGKDAREDLGPALARLIETLSRWLVRRETDVLVVLGDRLEVLGGACAALAAGVPVAHLHGGELAPGELDDRIRFAVSSMANLHFVATAAAQRRLLRLGESRDAVFRVGAIGLDHIYRLKKEFRQTNPAEVKAFFGLDPDRPMLAIVGHPCGFGTDGEYRNMQTVLSALKGEQGIIIGPNTDPGHSGITRAIREFLKSPSGCRDWRFFASLERTKYLQAIWASDALVGNSSSGILEANALGTAVVNIGPRQEGRERNGNTIIDVDYDARRIAKAVGEAIATSRARRVRPSRAFGTGDTGRRIAETLAEVSFDRRMRVKQFR